MRVLYVFVVLALLAVSIAANADPQIDGGEGYTCALGKSGRAFCWGTNTSGQTGSGLGMPAVSSVARPTEMAASLVTVASGGQHSCGLQADGSAYCWGDNTYGQIGNGASGPRVSLPVRVQTAVRFKSITVGGSHTCAIDEDNLAWCWGLNANSQIGQAPLSPSGLTGTLFATTPTLVLSPAPFAGLLEFQALSAGSAFTCGIDVSGVAWCWGSNVNGRAGIDVSQCGGPVALNCDFVRPTKTVASGGGVLTAGLFNLRFTAISAGELNTCAIDTGGGVQCWGPHFLRGSSFSGVVDRPSLVTGLLNSGSAVSISAGGRSVCAVMGSGELFCWGNHDHGQLGNGAPIAPGATSLTPVRVAGAQDYAMVSVGTAHACAKTLSGSARCWGIDDVGQLGVGGLGGGEQNIPVTVPGLESTRLSSGGQHVCSIDSAEVVACWGSNFWGQVGHGLTPDPAPTRSVLPTPVARFYGTRRIGPIPPPPSSPPEQLSNTMPMVKLAVGTVDFTRLSVGGQHTCALNAAGFAYCWGRDQMGQVGNGKTNPVACRYGKESNEAAPTCVPYPTIVSRSDGHQFVDISAGAAHNCARTASGIVSCWGSAIYGELGVKTTAAFVRVPTQIEVPFPYRIQMLDVSAGEASSCAVNGSDMFCWGAITGAATPALMKVPSGPNYVHVGTGARHACTSFPNMAVMCIGNNGFGELGDGTNKPSWTGTLVWAGTPLMSYSLSWSSTCGVDALAGGVLCWGGNSSGQLGNGTQSNANVPQTALTMPGFIATAAGTGLDHACAIDGGSGIAQCWGSTTAGQLGDARIDTKPSTVPVTVAAGWRVP